MRVFLSHNKADKEVARALGGYLVLAGAENVWFDEWEIRAGDSITGKLNEGLAEFDVFILLWSVNAARSNWVRRELESAIHRVVETRKARLVPCLLDDTPLPSLLQDIRAVDLKDLERGMTRLVDDLFGFRSRKDRLLAIQDALIEMNRSLSLGLGYSVFICCPRCGGDHTLEGWEDSDRETDSRYAGLRCAACGWEDGGEI